MPIIHRVQVDSTGNPLAVALTRRDGTPIDATGKTVKFLALDDAGEIAIAETDATVTDEDAAGGAEVQYGFQAGDVTTARRLFGYFRIYNGATLEETVPDEPSLIIDVQTVAPSVGPLTGYTSRDAVIKRLTETGAKWAFDKNKTGTVSDDEYARVLDPTLEYADNLIDGTIARLADPTATRALGLAWLRDRATDIATYRAATQGGRNVPDVLKEDYQRALDLLEEVRLGTLAVPGLPTSGTSQRRGVVAIPTYTETYRRCDRRRQWPY